MKISIITTTFNSSATVAETFESVLSQTFKDIEYIVVDGASKDDTLDIIKRYESAFDGRMRWISEKDSGVYDAMNKGLGMVTMTSMCWRISTVRWRVRKWTVSMAT